MNEKCTTIKHLYSTLAKYGSSSFLSWLSSETVKRHGPIPMEVQGLSAISEWIDSKGDEEFEFLYKALSVFSAWKYLGCQVFSIDEKTVDMLACTEAPSLSSLAPDGPVEGLDGWRTPYHTFAFELPYPVVSKLTGHTPRRLTTGIASPAWDLDSEKWQWNFYYLVPEDLARDGIRRAETPFVLDGIITNLCVFLNEGGDKSRAANRIGYKKRASKAGVKVNIWNIRLTTDLPLGIARPFLESGNAPKKTFRIGKRFMVRGHWRNQACGKNLSEVKRTWIKPYIKGPEEGEAWSRLYRVKG